ncbi:MAG: MFS transporter [Candidatus Thermoplasmatota archaeon]|nr:MFS transporter [Candidatus Thermoplasmatota archaeon]MCL5799849.1 MFS transporter [Candidatus Thermoplasmatota archaeon]
MISVEMNVAHERRHKQVITILSLGSFVNGLGQYIVWVIMAVYLNQARGVGYVGVGVVFMAGGLISVPASIYGGNLLDRLGRRRIMIAIPWIMTGMFAVLYISVTYELSIYLVEGLFIGVTPLGTMQYVAFNAIASDVTTPQERTNAFGVLRIASNAGIGAGLVLGGILSEVSYAVVFLLPTAGSLIEGMLYFARIPETSPRAIKGEKNATREKISVPIHDTLFITVSIVLAIGFFASGMFESALTPLYLSSVDGYSNLMVTGLFAVNTLVVLVAQGPINKIFHEYRDTTRIILGLSLFALGFLMFAVTSNYLLLAIAVIILTSGENLSSPSASALITKMAPEDRRGAYLGLNSSISSFISPFRPLAATTILAFSAAAPGDTWIFLSAFTFLAAFLLLAVFGISRKEMEGRKNS